MNNQKLTTTFLFFGVIFFLSSTFLTLKSALFGTVGNRLNSQPLRKPQHNIELEQRIYFVKNEYYDPKTEYSNRRGIDTPEKVAIADTIDDKAYKVRTNGKAINARQQLINCKSGQDCFPYYNKTDDLRVLKSSANPMFNSQNGGLDNFFIPEQEANNDFEMSLIFDDGKSIKFPKFNLYKELNLESKFDTNRELRQIKFISPDNKLIFYLVFTIN